MTDSLAQVQGIHRLPQTAPGIRLISVLIRKPFADVPRGASQSISPVTFKSLTAHEKI